MSMWRITQDPLSKQGTFKSRNLFWSCLSSTNVRDPEIISRKSVSNSRNSRDENGRWSMHVTYIVPAFFCRIMREEWWPWNLFIRLRHFFQLVSKFFKNPSFVNQITLLFGKIFIDSFKNLSTVISLLKFLNNTSSCY